MDSESGEGTATTTQAGVVRYANAAMARLVGRDAGALVGLSMSELVTPASRTAVQALLATVPGHTANAVLDLRGQEARGVRVEASATSLEIEGELVLVWVMRETASP